MQIGMNLYLWLTKLTPAHFPLLEELKDAGFDGVEIPAADHNPAELRTIRRALADHGLACTVATLLAEPNNPISESAFERKAARDHLFRHIEMAAELGADTLVGPMHSAHKRFVGRGPDEREFARCVEFLWRAGEYAQQAGIYLSVEPLNRFESYFLNTAAQARRLMEAVGHECVGVLYDTHHGNIEEGAAFEAIASLGRHLRHFHVSESHRGTPGTGSVDWSGSFQALGALDYQSWLVIEAFGSEVPGIPEAVNIWRNCFADRREVYRRGIALIRRGLAQHDRISS